jgi:hypothetical protein
MTEEELAASLGLRQSRHMKAVRWIVLRLAPRSTFRGSAVFVRVLGYYQRLGMAIVDQKSDEDNAHAKAQIALTLLMAGVHRDIACMNRLRTPLWIENLNDALDNAWDLRLDNVAEAIKQLLANGASA